MGGSEKWRLTGVQSHPFSSLAVRSSTPLHPHTIRTMDPQIIPVFSKSSLLSQTPFSH